MSKHKKTAVITDTANAEAIKAAEKLKKKEQALADKTSPDASGKGLKSKKKLILGLLMVVLVAVGAGGYYVLKLQGKDSESKKDSTTTESLPDFIPFEDDDPLKSQGVQYIYPKEEERLSPT